MNFFSKSNYPIIVAIDISENGVRGSIIKKTFNKTKRDIFLYQTQKVAGSDGTINSMSDLTECTEKVVETLIEKGEDILNRRDKIIKKQLNDFIFILDSPFQYSYLTNIISANEEPVRITDAFIEHLLEKTRPETREAADFFDKNKDSLEFIKRKVMNVSLNGYQVNKIYDKQARFIDLLILSSIAPQKTLLTLQSQVKKKLKKANIKFLPRSEVDLTFLNKFNKNDLYKYIKVTMSETFIAVVDKEVPQDISYIPYGYQSIVKEISKSLEVPMFIASSYASIYFSKKIEKSFADKIDSIISSILKNWEDEYEKGMKYRPNKVFLDCDKDMEDFIKKILIKKHPETEVDTLKDLYVKKTGFMPDIKTELVTDAYFINRMM